MSQDMRQLRIWLPAHSNEVIVTSLAAIEASQTATNHCRYIIRVQHFPALKGPTCGDSREVALSATS